MLDERGVQAFRDRDPIKSRFCKDCRGYETSRQRDNFVPLHAILEAVADLKRKA